MRFLPRQRGLKSGDLPPVELPPGMTYVQFWPNTGRTREHAAKRRRVARARNAASR